jgi:hypothetical protein
MEEIQIWKKYEFDNLDQFFDYRDALDLSAVYSIVILGSAPDEKQMIDVIWQGIEEPPADWVEFEVNPSEPYDNYVIGLTFNG